MGRSPWRLTVRRLMAVVALLGVLLGGVAWLLRPTAEARALRAISASGGNWMGEHRFDDGPVRAVSTNDASDATLAALKGLPELRHLYLANSRHITDGGLAHLRELPNLKELDLRGTPITDAGLMLLGGLHQLRSLCLRHCRVSDAGLAHLRELAELRVLDLQGTQVTDAGLVHLRGMVGLRILDLKDTAVTGAGIAALHRALPRTRIDRNGRIEAPLLDPQRTWSLTGDRRLYEEESPR